MLSEIGLQRSHLISVEDLVHNGTTQSGLQADKTRFFLINHNKMAGRHDEDYSSNVLGCIDSHRDEGWVPRSTQEPRVVVLSGSTTSLVVNWAKSEWDYLESGHSKSHEQFAKFALAPILLLTQNLEGNTSEEDIQAVKFLERKLGYGSDSNTFDRNAYYQYLVGGGSSTSQAPIAAVSSTTTAPTTSSATAIDNTAAFEKASALSSGTTGYYDPYAKEETTGPTGFAYRFKGDSTTAGNSGVESTAAGTTDYSTTGGAPGYSTTTGTSNFVTTSSQSASAYETTTGAGDRGTANESTTEENANEAADAAQSGHASGGITGAASAVLNFFTGKGKSHETEEPDEAELDTTSGAVGAGTDVSANEATGAETGAYTPHSTSGDTGVHSSQYQNTTGTGGSSTAGTITGSSYLATTESPIGDTTTAGLAPSVVSKMPWLVDSEATTTDVPSTSTSSETRRME